MQWQSLNSLVTKYHVILNALYSQITQKWLNIFQMSDFIKLYGKHPPMFFILVLLKNWTDMNLMFSNSICSDMMPIRKKVMIPCTLERSGINHMARSPTFS